jgi:hypothetical protein
VIQYGTLLKRNRMKKWLIGIVLLLGVVLAAKQLSQNDYSSAKKLAEAGNYQAFYSEIKENVAKGDKEATNLLMDYFLKAVQDVDIAEVKYYLDQDRSLIDRECESKHRNGRAIYAALLAYDGSDDMIKLLLSYRPELNFQIKNIQNVSPLQMAVMDTRYKDNLHLIQLLIDSGANQDFYTHGDYHYSNNSPVMLAYLNDKLDVFTYLLKRETKTEALIHHTKKHQDFILDDIAMSYFDLMIKKGIDVTPPLKQDFLNALNQSDYRALHQKNMKYVTALLHKGLIYKVSENELKKLFVYYMSVREVDGTKVFIDHGMCQKYSNLCTQAIKAAHMNNFTEIEKLIQENK